MNYQDTFVECMIKRRPCSKDYLIYMGIGLLGAAIVLLGVLGFLLTGVMSIAFFALVGAIAGVYYLFTRRNLEFEYAVTNGDVSVDKIVNRRSRKRLTSFDSKDIEEMGEYAPNAAALKTKRVDKVINASKYDDGRDATYVIAKSKKTGLTLIMFSPDERTTEAMKPYLPRQIRVDMMKKEREKKFS